MNFKASQVVGQEKSEFGKIRSILLPIHRFELKKFIPMSLLLFCMLFIQTMLRDLKDIFILKLAFCGEANLIPQIKLWFVMPTVFLTIMLYSFLINKFGFKKTFYLMTLGLTLFYIVFYFILLPNVELFHANEEQINAMRLAAPSIFYYIIPCLANWSYTLFYIFAEMWSAVMIQSLFWQFANYITMENEVKRFYTLYPLIGFVGALASGSFLKIMSQSVSEQRFLANIKILLAVCIILCMFLCILFTYINKVVLKDPRLFDKTKIKPRKKKEKVGFLDGFKILFHSKYLLLIALISISYGLCITFSNVVWKEQVSMIYTGSGYASMMANIEILSSTFSIIMSVAGTNLLRKFKWKTVALITPVVLSIFGGLFLLLVLYSKLISPTIFGLNALYFAVWFGVFQDSLSKSCKYTIFDSTKNMAYIPLDYETKTKGQAAVEIAGTKLGKASSSIIQVFLTNIFNVGSRLSSHLFTVISIISLTIIGWIVSISKLSIKYEQKVKESHEQK